ncbi:hypothetical protein K438DRAFT_1975479 [Mycena galopus ATCC 62051]|nr:hypothetical protein K438DRAFT_1975479 [Mycena galopus ATCC 62051]
MDSSAYRQYLEVLSLSRSLHFAPLSLLTLSTLAHSHRCSSCARSLLRALSFCAHSSGPISFRAFVALAGNSTSTLADTDVNRSTSASSLAAPRTKVIKTPATSKTSWDIISWATFANDPPAGQLRLATPAVVDFTAALFTAAA